MKYNKIDPKDPVKIVTYRSIFYQTKIKILVIPFRSAIRNYEFKKAK